MKAILINMVYFAIKNVGIVGRKVNDMEMLVDIIFGFLTFVLMLLIMIYD
jgi:hypothetical protein